MAVEAVQDHVVAEIAVVLGDGQSRAPEGALEGAEIDPVVEGVAGERVLKDVEARGNRKFRLRSGSKSEYDR